MKLGMFCVNKWLFGRKLMFVCNGWFNFMLVIWERYWMGFGKLVFIGIWVFVFRNWKCWMIRC